MQNKDRKSNSINLLNYLAAKLSFQQNLFVRNAKNVIIIPVVLYSRYCNLQLQVELNDCFQYKKINKHWLSLNLPLPKFHSKGEMCTLFY